MKNIQMYFFKEKLKEIIQKEKKKSFGRQISQIITEEEQQQKCKQKKWIVLDKLPNAVGDKYVRTCRSHLK